MKHPPSSAPSPAHRKTRPAMSRNRHSAYSNPRHAPFRHPDDTPAPASPCDDARPRRTSSSHEEPPASPAKNAPAHRATAARTEAAPPASAEQPASSPLRFPTFAANSFHSGSSRRQPIHTGKTTQQKHESLSVPHSNPADPVRSGWRISACRETNMSNIDSGSSGG